MDVKETILEQHRTLQRVKKFKEQLQEMGSTGAFLVKIGILDEEEAKHVAILAVMGDVLENIINGMEPDTAIIDTVMQQLKEFDLDVDED